MVAGRSGDADRDRPAAGDEGGGRSRSRRLRTQGSVDGQGPGGRYAVQGGRYGDPALRGAWLFQGYGAGVDLPLRAAGQAGGRRLGGPQDGAESLIPERG